MTTKQEVDSIDSALADADRWTKPKKAPKSAKRQRDAVVSVRLTPDELQRVQTLADEAKLPISTFLRDRALREANDRMAMGSMIAQSAYRHAREDTSRHLLVSFTAGTPISNWAQPTVPADTEADMAPA